MKQRRTFLDMTLLNGSTVSASSTKVCVTFGPLILSSADINGNTGTGATGGAPGEDVVLDVEDVSGEDLLEETGKELLADTYVLAAEEQGMDEGLVAKQDWPTGV